jgi:patatin-like phospholipase/acyl hydrolase
MLTDIPNDASPGESRAIPERFQILSLDGGGIRGVFTVAVLAAIEEDLGTSIVRHFDLIAGTSTGGIIAIALGLGIPPRDILQFYLRHGPNIFRQLFGLTWCRHWLRHKYADGPLERALREIFGDRLFGESTTRLVIPSYNLGEDDVYIFRTPHLERLKRDYRVPAWQVGMATSAAPTYFPAFRKLDSVRLVDGGVWANNPSMVAIIEAVGALGLPRKCVSLLSIGTMWPVSIRPSYLNWAGLLAWAMSAPEVILKATSVGVVNQARYLLGADSFHRLDPRVPDSDLELDRVDASHTYLGRARHYSRSEMPFLRARFFGHLAQPYIPIHHPPIEGAR